MTGKSGSYLSVSRRFAAALDKSRQFALKLITVMGKGQGVQGVTRDGGGDAGALRKTEALFAQRQGGSQFKASAGGRVGQVPEAEVGVAQAIQPPVVAGDLLVQLLGG